MRTVFASAVLDECRADVDRPGRHRSATGDIEISEDAVVEHPGGSSRQGSVNGKRKVRRFQELNSAPSRR
jgi:hypothetical protein